MRRHRSFVFAGGILLSAAISILAVEARRAPASSSVPSPPMVELTPGTVAYRASGTFTRDGRAAAAPRTTVAMPHGVAIMRRQVTAAEYRRCADAAACPMIGQDATAPDRPAVKISWRDAQAYAAWLSRETGAHFRLPTDAEWAYAAGDRFQDDGPSTAADAGDPGARALARYSIESARDDGIEQVPQAIGSFGANDKGILDFAGNVWEWTDTCFSRNALDAQGGAAPTMVSCGVRVVEGRHRTYLSDFFRDARGGGCSVGRPPSNLGFRLVRDDDRTAEPWATVGWLLADARQLVRLGR